MHRATLSATIALLLLSGPADATLRGSWSATRIAGDPGRIHLQLNRAHGNFGQTMRLADFTGLTAAQVGAPVATPVSFTLRREAGTLQLAGTFSNGDGGGQLTFTPNHAFLDALRQLGVRDIPGQHHRGSSPEERLFGLAVLDVSTSFVRSLQAAGYHESLDSYTAMRIFGVTPQRIAEFRALGMRLSADQLVAAQIHGVTPAYVSRMRREHGEHHTFEDLVATRIHGATPELIAEMTALGYGELDLDHYVAFRIHGVTPGFVEELAALGYDDLAADQLVAFRIHGVTPSFIREQARHGHRRISPDDLVSMRIHRRWR